MQSHRTLNAASILLQHVQHFQAIFRAADASGDGSLDEREFLAAFRGHLGADDKALRRVFMAIDSNCDGLVNWDEFSAYLLLEKTAACTTEGPAHNGSSGSSKAVSMFHDLHAGSAAGVSGSSGAGASQVPLSCLLHADASGAADRWYSAGSDGVVQVWNGKDLGHMRSYHSGLSAVTSAAFLPSSSLLALGSYSSSLQLLEPSTGRHAGALANVASTAALSLAAWPAPDAGVAGGAGGLAASVLGRTVGSVLGDGGSTSRGVVEACRDYLAVGDADGSVRLLQLDCDETADKKSSDRFTTKKLWHSPNHRDWVVSVLHCPQISSVAAASLDKTLSITDLERCIAVRTLKGHTKPVHCCAWTSMLKVLASGSADRRVLLWNPFSCRILGTLEGHSAPVVCLASNERDMQIMSAAADNTVKVWDLRSQRCLQTLQLSPSAGAIGGHHAPLSVMGFSPSTRLLVAGAVRLQGWRLADRGVSARVGHREAVGWAGYVEEMQEVVSTDHAGTVCCWDLTSGQLLHSFGNTHGSCRISTAALDDSRRRLITGAEDGSINVWNFRSGVLLSTLSDSPDQGSGSQWGSGSGVEVTGLAVATSTDTNGQAAACIVATGWNRKVTWYADTGKRRCPMLRSFPGADSDVLAAAAMEGHPTLATACDNGEVWLWNLDSGAVLRKLVPPGLQARPQAEQAVEALAFMHSNLKHILIAVGADRVLRFFGCHSGNCLEHDTSDTTAPGESLCAVAVAAGNTQVFTADTAGTVTAWDISSILSTLHAMSASALHHRSRPSSAMLTGSRVSAAVLGGGRGLGFSGGSRPQSAASGGSPRAFSRAAGVSGVACAAQQAMGVERVAAWRAHGDAVTALVWVPAPAGEAAVNAAAAACDRDGDDAAEADAQQQRLPAVQSAQRHVTVPDSVRQQQWQWQQQGQEKQPMSAVLQAAEGQQQAQQLLAMMQQQQQVPPHLQASHEQQQQQPWPPDSRTQQLAAAMQGMRAAADIRFSSSSGGDEAAATAATAAAAAAGCGGGFLLSAGLDRSMVLWSSSGAKVGVLGSSRWQMGDPTTWQDPCTCTSSSCEAAHSADAAADVLLPQYRLRSSLSSSGDYSQISLSPRADDAAAEAAEAAARDRRSDSNGQVWQQQQQQQRVPARQQQPHSPATRQGTARQPAAKAVAFADDVAATTGRPASAAAAAAAVAAAVAAATLDAKLPSASVSTPEGQPEACSGDVSGAASTRPQQQQPGCLSPLGTPSKAAAGRGRMSVSTAGAPAAQEAAVSSRGQGGWQARAAAAQQAAAPDLPCLLAGEEDLPTSLWLPQFNSICGRPATAVHRPTAAAAAAGAKGRPSTAAAALGGGGVGMGGRLQSRGSVFAAAGRSSVMLGGGGSGSPSTGVLGRSKGAAGGVAVERGVAAVSRAGQPKSAGASKGS